MLLFIYFTVYIATAISVEVDSDKLTSSANCLSVMEEEEISRDFNRVYIRDTSSQNFAETSALKRPKLFMLKRFLSRIFSLKL